MLVLLLLLLSGAASNSLLISPLPSLLNPPSLSLPVLPSYPLLPSLSTPVLWISSIHTNYRSGPSGSAGFADEMVDFVLALSRHVRLGWRDDTGVDWRSSTAYSQLRESERKILDRLWAEGEVMVQSTEKKIVVLQFQPHLYSTILSNYPTISTSNSYIIGRAMFETDSLPEGWVEALNTLVHEVWVPSHFARDVFLREGVVIPVAVIGEALDTGLFNRHRAKDRRRDLFPMCRPGDFIFLSNGKHETRKGWDSLLRSFSQEFSPREGVCLYIRMGGTQRLPLDLREMVGRHRVYTVQSQHHMSYPNLYKSADGFVLATHGEGWGRPVMESLSMGLPTIVPLWAGLTAFVREDYSIPVPVTELEPASFGEGDLEGHLWASVNETALSEAMRWVFKNREEARELGRRAERVVRKEFGRKELGELCFQRLLNIEMGEV
eukprot:sb/3464827/